MGFGKFTILILLVIVAGALVVMALPGGKIEPIPMGNRGHPWKPFAAGAGDFEVPPGWLAYDPFTRVALGESIGGCRHTPPRHSRAAYLRSPDQRVELFLAFGPAGPLSNLLPAVEREPSDTIAALASSSMRVAGMPLRWRSWDRNRSLDEQARICLVGSARTGEELFLIHVSGRPEGADLEAIAALVASIQLPGS